MAQSPNQVSGLGTTTDAGPRMVSLGHEMFREGGRIIAGDYSRDPANTGDIDMLRAGLVLGKRSSDDKYAPSIIGVLPSAHDGSGTTNTSMTVGTAAATEINRRIGSSGTFKVTGPPSASGTVATTTVTFSAVNTSTGIVTISDIAVDKIEGSFIQPTDGSEDPLALLGNGFPVQVTDEDRSTDIDASCGRILIGGRIDVSQIINYPSDSSLKTWIKSELNGGDGTGSERGPFSFDDDV